MSYKVGMYFGVIIVMITFVVIAIGFFIAFANYQKRILLKQQEIHEVDIQHKKELISTNIQSAETERIRIAKDIHDEIGSIFSTLSLTINQIDKNDLNTSSIQSAKKLVQTGINSVRRISHAIVPFELELLGLQETLENYYETIESASGIKTEIVFTGDDKLLTPDITLNIYRILQELISNSLKYSSAKKINTSINLTLNDNLMTMSYSDDGIGINLSDKKNHKGIGFKNIESRVIFLNGDFEINTSYKNGFKCTILIPTKKE